MGYDENDETIQSFFKQRPTTSKHECDDIAGGIVGRGAVIESVDTQGSMSYTVTCTTKTIISFRRVGNLIDSNVVGISKDLHRGLVPSASYCGKVGQGDETLTAYKMTYLPGRPCLEIYPRVAELDSEDEVKCATMYKHLARYFARTWLAPMSKNFGREAATLMEKEDLKDDEAWFRRRLSVMGAAQERFPYIQSFIDESEEDVIPVLFGRDWPKVLTHGDFSKRNILLDPQTFAVTGIVDWSLASIRPFGLDLELLLDLRGFSNDDDDGAAEYTTTEYTCHEKLEDVFWEEFWALAGVEGVKRRSHVKRVAMLAAKLDALMKYGFQLEKDGGETDRLTVFNDDILKDLFDEKPGKREDSEADLRGEGE
ncbi:Uu.00g004020.m01.CDS01 [Anthostomella pinea]|uniref:Uu.00g004020.m01.CDS01 n=1 Tax=Anthostomella pinea TaxID=933095 RepID=A0AAI8YIS7_9PEZI|nr:Uu.00g004020.m01.CDS01 [Anthostomella pinea]